MVFNLLKKTAHAKEEPVVPSTTRTRLALDDSYDVATIKKRFLRINQERLIRTQDSLRARQKDFIDLLPLLFHINHPMLPGYVSTVSPCGIADYQPNQNSVKASRQFAKIALTGTQLLPSFAVYAIFIMGSVGTIAHSDKSDLDIWLCYNPQLSPPEIFELGKKASIIEEWAIKNIELEVHFFLMDATKFKNGETTDLSSESSGTAQHHLLLEEFYRTGLFVAGRYPAWWLVPPDHEKDYNDYLNLLLEKRIISTSDIIDFGGLAKVPAEEFVGAGLWQVYKGIDSPYKSVLKILLMEIYANEYPNIDLLSLRYKKAVYAGVTDVDPLDPYIMLIKKLEEYLIQRNELTRLELVRRCFYIKINVALSSDSVTRVAGWRRELMESLVREWKWDKDQLALIDMHEKWKIAQVLKERKSLTEELTNSYLFLSNFGREHTQLLSISKDDLNILGRKLYAAFERKIEKIEIVYRGIVKELFETHITIQQLTDQEGWLLLNSAPNTQKKEPIKQAPSVVTLLAWAYFNKILGPRTLIALQARGGLFDSKEVNAILRCLKEFSPESKLPPLEIENLKKAPQLIGALVFINVGIDPMVRYNRGGVDLISNRGDVLSYGNTTLNLAATIDLLLLTSWQEVLNYTYKDMHGLVESLCRYLSLNMAIEGEPPPAPKTYSFSSTYAISLTRRLDDLFSTVREFFMGDRVNQVLRYLLVCGNMYYLIHTEGGEINYVAKESLIDLQRLLMEPNLRFANLCIDKYALVETPLPVIYQANHENVVQLFYQIMGKIVNIYVLDERGSLFYQRSPFYHDEILINHFNNFFESAFERRAQAGSKKFPLVGVMFYQINNDNGNYSLTEKTPNKIVQQKRYFNVRVRSDDGNSNFAFECDGQEFSFQKYGNTLFQEVANYIMSRRRKGLQYPLYITNIDLLPSLTNRTPDDLQMMDFLNYKKRIEDKLNEKMSFDAEN